MPLKKSIQSTGPISHGTKLFEMKLRCDRPTQKFQWVRIVDSFSGPQPVVTALRCDYSASIFYFTKFATFTPFEESAIPVRNRVYWLSSLPDKFPTFFPSTSCSSLSPVFITIILLHLLLSHFATSTDVHHLKAPTVSNLLSLDRPKDFKSLMEFKWNYSSIKVMGLKAPSTVSRAGQRHSIRNPISCKSTQVNP